MEPLAMNPVCRYCHYSPIDGGLLERCVGCLQRQNTILAYQRQVLVHQVKLLLSAIKLQCPAVLKRMTTDKEYADRWYEELFDLVEAELEHERRKKT
jgi:hypothetical protein